MELAWLSPSIIAKTPCGAHCSQPSLVLVCWSLFHSWGWLGLLHGHVGVDFSCGFFGADFWVRIFFADFGVRIFSRILWWPVRILGCGFFSADFLGCFPAEKALKKIPSKKSHPKIFTKDPVQEATTHNHAPSGKTQQISSERLGADAPCREPFSLHRWRLSGRMSV